MLNTLYVLCIQFGVFEKATREQWSSVFAVALNGELHTWTHEKLLADERAPRSEETHSAPLLQRIDERG